MAVARARSSSIVKFFSMESFAPFAILHSLYTGTVARMYERAAKTEVGILSIRRKLRRLILSFQDFALLGIQESISNHHPLGRQWLDLQRKLVGMVA